MDGQDSLMHLFQAVEASYDHTAFSSLVYFAVGLSGVNFEWIVGLFTDNLS